MASSTVSVLLLALLVLGTSEASSMMGDGIRNQLQGMRDEDMKAQVPTARDELWMHNNMVKGRNAAPTASRGFEMMTIDHGAQAPSAGVRGEGGRLKEEIAAAPVDQIAAVPVASHLNKAQAPVAKSMAAAPVNMASEMMVGAQSPVAMAGQSQAPVASFGLSQEMIGSRQAAPVSSIISMTIQPAEPPTTSFITAQAPTSSFMKMTEPAQAPTTSFKDSQAPTSSMRIAQAPSASLSAAQAPTSSIRTAQAPSTSFNAAQAPTSSLRMAQAPTAELKVAQTSLLRTAQAPSTSLTTAQAPSSALTQAPSASFNAAQAPTSSLTQAPSASFNVAQSLRTAQAPSASFDAAQAPTSSLRTAQAPSASFEAAQAPTSSMRTSQAPSASLRTAQAPTASFPHRAARKDIFGRRLQAPADVCLTPPTCDPNGAYVECTKGGRISCQCSWVARCQPNVSDCFLHTNDKIATSCGF